MAGITRKGFKLMKRILAVLFLIVAFAGSGAAKEQVLVFRFRGVGVDEGLVDAVSVIFNGALDAEGVYISVNPFKVLGDVECHDFSCAVSLTREAGLDKAVTGSLTRLGGKIIVNASLVDARSEEVIVTVDGVAQTEEDLDIVLKRVAKGLTTGRKIDDTAEVGLITENEYMPQRRRESFAAKGFRVGFMWPVSGSMGGVDRLTAIDFVYQYDTSDYFLAGRSGLRWGGDLDDEGYSATDFAILETKLGKYMSRSDFSPFISAGVGIHWLKVREKIEEGGFDLEYDDSGTGLCLLAGCGFAAFRTYDFQFQLDIDYFIIIEKLGVHSEGDYPHGVIFTFCIKKGRSSQDE